MYAAVAAQAFQAQLAYRGQVWAHIFGQLIQVFFKIAIWIAVYRGVTAVDGVSLPEMITYAVLAGTVLSAWEWGRLIQGLDVAISKGDIAVFLLRPLRYPLYLLATECGNLLFRLVAVVLPIVLSVGYGYGLLPPASATHALLFLPFWLLSFLLLFLLSLLFGLSAFWLMTAFSLEWTLQALITLLGGTFIPLWFFPEPFGAAVGWLPFAWIGFYPAAVWLGTLEVGPALLHLAAGVGWAVLLALAAGVLWRRAARQITVQGG